LPNICYASAQSVSVSLQNLAHCVVVHEWSRTKKNNFNYEKSLTLSLSYSSEIHTCHVMSSEGFYALAKMAVIYMFSEGSAAHPVEYNSPLQNKMAIWRTF
jgi:hypothetical protein